jgi:hypothetical protein
MNKVESNPLMTPVKRANLEFVKTESDFITETPTKPGTAATSHRRTISTASGTRPSTQHGNFTARSFGTPRAPPTRINEEFIQIRRNVEMTDFLKKEWNQFYNKMRLISEINQKDTKYLKQEIPKLFKHIDKVYDKIEDLKNAPFKSLPMEFSSFRDEKRFKDKLIDHILSKIKDKDSFLNVLINKEREEREKNYSDQIMRLLEYDLRKDL